jgi:DNA polymerase
METREIRRRQYLDAMGVQVWESRVRPAAPEHGQAPAAGSPQARAPQPAIAGPSPGVMPDITGQAHAELAADVQHMGWESLAQAVQTCRGCSLHTTRNQTVFGTGNRQAQWLFVGEAPGADEDRQGEPFVGRAGQLLNAMLHALGLTREAVYIANVLKCRPPENRDPRPEEAGQCEPYLVRQIQLIRPRVIVALGRHAAHSLLKSDASLASLRGRAHQYHGIPLVVTYHPAYLLRTPGDKRKAWQDLRLAHSILQGDA